MSIKRLPPEAIETFSILLHPKRKYSARKPSSGGGVTGNFLLTESGEPLLTESGEHILVEP